jgi:hypothetical protein
LSEISQREENNYYVLEPESPEPARAAAIKLFKQWLLKQACDKPQQAW